MSLFVLALAGLGLLTQVLAIALGTSGGIWLVGLYRDAYWPWLVSGALFAGAAFGLERVVSRRRARRDPRLCQGCGYDTTGLDPAGVCPECGALYRRERGNRS